MGYSDVTKAFVLPVLFLFSLLSVYCSGAAAGPDAFGPNAKQRVYRQGEVLVKFRAEAGAAGAAQHTALGAAVKRRLGAGRIDVVRLPEGMDVERAVRLYRTNPLVERAEPNYIVHLAALPNDPRFVSEQWALYNTGQTVRGNTGTTGADIHATAAWDLHTGDGSVVVAILDTGVDYGHPDLAPNIWVNADDPQDGQDNDRNGFTDDVRGWNFVAGNNDPLDDDTLFSHGTHVAGVIGAACNNGVGVCGINWAVRIMPLKVLGGDVVGELADIIAAVDYAIANGARVVNASYTYPQGCLTLPLGPSTLEREAIERARDAGIVFVAAAGNFGCDNDVYPFYPANHRVANVVSVAATDARDRLAVFSNAGDGSVYLGAPGVDILSTFRRESGEYGYLTGTSMASPMVAGGAALLASYRPALSGKAVREILLRAVTPLTSLIGRTMSGGRLNLESALSRNLALDIPFRPAYLTAERRPDARIDLAWLDNSTIEDRYELERRSGAEGQYAPLGGSLAADTESYADTGVSITEGSVYHYRVRAGNGNGVSEYSNEATVAIPPNAPTGLVAKPSGAGRVSLSWADNSAIEDGFQIERQVEGGLFSQIATAGPNATGFTDTTVVASTTYTYRIRAYDAASGHSDYATSGPVTATAQTGNGDSGGGGGGCFIATAAFGSELHPKVALLRRFRDEYLLPTPWGRRLVDAYYRMSPPIAEVIAGSGVLRAAVRAGLTPIVWGVELAMSGRPPVEPGHAPASVPAADGLLVKFRPDVSRQQAEALIRAQGAEVERYMAPADVYVIRPKDSVSVEEAVESFGAIEEVERAEPNIRVSR